MVSAIGHAILTLPHRLITIFLHEEYGISPDLRRG